VIIPSRRSSDNDIYLKEDRYNEPKEIFKFLVDIINGTSINEPLPKLLDVGCATGELIYFLKKQCPHFHYFGIDVSSEMLAYAMDNIKDVQLCEHSIMEAPLWENELFDIVVCSGVIGIFDEIENSLGNLIQAVKPNGHLLVVEQFNDDPIDVIMRYRRFSEKDDFWEAGWNIFSKKTIESIAHKHNKKVKWHEFNLPFKLPKGNDPMRSWTIKTENKNNQLILGSKQLIDLYVAEIF